MSTLDGSARQQAERISRGLARRIPRRATIRGMPLRAVFAGRELEYVTTRCRFGGVELLVGPGVFLPRSVSEPIVDAAQAAVERDDSLVVDVGTGCGAVALALAKRLPRLRVVGMDIDEPAVLWARRNAELLHADGVSFLTGGLLDPLDPAARGQVDLIVANMPCVPATIFEGAADALDHAYVGGGDDGLGLLRALMHQAVDVLRPGGSLVVQMSPAQWAGFSAEAAALGYQPEERSRRDFVVIGQLRRPVDPTL
jgi:release factor glutamine methyltransferase